MRCPVDNETLVMADRSGVEIDYCPKCRGVWLDRGELDKIIERAAGGPAPQSQPVPPSPQPYPQPAQYQAQQGRPYGKRDDDDDDDYRSGYKKKRREGFLGELFDF
jgi:uncharacterized protein